MPPRKQPKMIVTFDTETTGKGVTVVSKRRATKAERIKAEQQEDEDDAYYNNNDWNWPAPDSIQRDTEMQALWKYASATHFKALGTQDDLDAACRTIDDLTKRLAEATGLIAEMKVELILATKPTETEALAKMERDMERERKQYRKATMQLETTIGEHREQIAQLRHGHNINLRQLESAKQLTASFTATLNTIRVQPDRPRETIVPGVPGEMKRGIEDALTVPQPQVPAAPPPRRGPALEID